MRSLPALGLVLAAVLVTGGCTPGPSSSTPPSSPTRTDAASPDSAATVKGTSTATPGVTVVFGAGGDLGANQATTRGLDRLDGSPAQFFLALGDLDYDETTSDVAWCTYVKDHLPAKGAEFPFELVVGNHEADDGSDGKIADFAACLGDRLDATGAYDRQYALRYPASDPLVQVIMIAPEITAGGHTYDYRKGTADRRWLVDRIDAAREAGIRWVVVGMHYPCISSGAGHPGCASGTAVLNLLLRKKVDLLLTGHNHIYQRSKQISLGRGCARVAAARYDVDCVVDPGADGVYRAGHGTVQVTSGRVGGRRQGINPRDSDHRWFVKSGGRTTGWTRFDVTATSLRGRWVNTGGPTQDSFVIRQ